MTLLLIVLGILPSLLWLSLYLKEDDHPEPRWLIIRTFFFGALAAAFAARTEDILMRGLEAISLPGIITQILLFFVVIAFVEEYWKYLAVKVTDEPLKSFDEPTDAMIYLIVAALGFAAVENLLAVFAPFIIDTAHAVEVTFLRSISATLLHVLASGIVGFYLAQRHFFLKKYAVIKGLVLAAFLHGLYNILTLRSNAFEHLIITFVIVLLLGGMAIAVNELFYKLKKDYYA